MFTFKMPDKGGEIYFCRLLKKSIKWDLEKAEGK